MPELSDPLFKLLPPLTDLGTELVRFECIPCAAEGIDNSFYTTEMPVHAKSIHNTEVYNVDTRMPWRT